MASMQKRATTRLEERTSSHRPNVIVVCPYQILALAKHDRTIGKVLRFYNMPMAKYLEIAFVSKIINYTPKPPMVRLKPSTSATLISPEDQLALYGSGFGFCAL